MIVTYKEREFIRQCIAQIQTHLPRGLQCEIIVVDNNSSDGTKDVLRSIPNIRVIQNERNIGFGAANNRGIRASSGKYVFVLNPDIFVQENSFTALFEFMEQNKQVAVCGPRLSYPDGTDQPSANNWPRSVSTPLVQRTFFGDTAWGRREKARYHMNELPKDSPSAVPWLVGAALFIRRSALDFVKGGFDERFFIYFEDIDLCRQFWHAGCEVWYVPLSRMIHFHRRESARGGLIILRNRLYRIHLISLLKYFIKWRGIKNPEVAAHPRTGDF